MWCSVVLFLWIKTLYTCHLAIVIENGHSSQFTHSSVLLNTGGPDRGVLSFIYSFLYSMNIKGLQIFTKWVFTQMMCDYSYNIGPSFILKRMHYRYKILLCQGRILGTRINSFVVVIFDLRYPPLATQF